MSYNNNTNCTGTSSPGDSSHLSCVLLEITGTPESVEEILTRLGPLINDDLRLKLEIVFQISLFTVTSLFGTVANVINITVYWKQGLKDSITVGLFALAISDFFVIFFPLFTAGGYIADHLLPGSSIIFKALAGVSTTQARHLVYSLSCTLTAFLSIERCFCVVRPFKVKLIFTRNRTIFIVLSMVVFYVLAFIPMFATHQLRWQPDRRQNNNNDFQNLTDVLTLWYHPAAVSVTTYNSSLMSIAIPTAAQIIVTCTAVIMIDGLRKAAKFRRSVTTEVGGGGSNNTTAKNSTQTGTKLNKEDANTSKCDERAEVVLSQGQTKKVDGGGRKIGEGLDSRDARLVKTMLILVVILSAANIPYISLKYTQLIVPEMNPRKRYQNTFRLMSSINFLLGSLNASVNVLVYYYTGTRYREIFKNIFCKK